MRKRIIITDNIYLTLGMMCQPEPCFFSFLSHDAFFLRDTPLDNIGETYIFDISKSKYEIIKVVKKIKEKNIDLVSNCVILCGASTELPCLPRFSGFSFIDIKIISNKVIKKIEQDSIYSQKRMQIISDKELSVLKLLIIRGCLTSVAKKMDRSIKTISSQKRSAMMKLGIINDVNLFIFMKSFY